MLKLVFTAICLTSLLNQLYAGNNNSWLTQYNVKWNTPSSNASESMPLGGGDIGCNVWVESGNLYFYAQRSGAFSENGEYLKLGRFKVTLTPNPFKNYNTFRQELILKDGYVEIESKGKNPENNFAALIKLWVDIPTHSIHLDINSEKEITATVTYESWRTEDKLLLNEKKGRFGCFSLEGYPGQVVKQKDEIDYKHNGILFYHRNPQNCLSPDLMLKVQGLEKHKDQIVNNIANRTSGGILYGTNFTSGSTQEGTYLGTPFKAWTLASIKPAQKHHLTIVTHIAQTESLAQWENHLLATCKQVNKTKGNLSENKKWWNNFWQRSWIITLPNKTERSSELWQTARNYQLMRYQLGCNLYGDYPSKFNGGNFTVDPILTDKSKPHDPDWRAWGGDVFTAQNQRLLYWPMLKAGDADGLKSQFNLYEQGLSGASLKVKEHFGHDGAIFCEYASASGLDFGAGWGWTESALRTRGPELPFGHKDVSSTYTYNQPVEKGIMANGSIAYHWESQVEHAYMMLEYHRFTGKNIDQYIPFIKQSLIFFDQHYQIREQMRSGKTVDKNGKLVFYPSTSCESYRGAKNPADLISGIRACLEALNNIDSKAISAQDKIYFKQYLQRLPELSLGVVKGDTVVEPAESYEKYQNVECPQFYPLFPFNRYDIKSDMIPIFKNTWKHGRFPKNMVISWHQDGIFYARMGMEQDALTYNIQKLKDAPRRFPSFWGPGHDWVPDHNWGGSGMIGLQEMLMQTIDNKIYLLPAWPANLDVCFKLHAPQNTTVEVEYIAGKIQKLIVKPESRKKDIQLIR